MKIRAKIAAGSVIALIATGAIGSAAIADSPSNPAPGPVADVVIGTLDGPAKAKNDGIELKTKADTKVASFELKYPMGSFSGWHKHPGIVIAVVKTGKVVRQVGCHAKVFSAGDSFTEVEPHFVKNYYAADSTDPEATDAYLEITQIYPADAPARRIEQNPPKCPYGVHLD